MEQVGFLAERKGNSVPLEQDTVRGCSPTETSSMQLPSKGGYAEIQTTSPA